MSEPMSKEGYDKLVAEMKELEGMRPGLLRMMAEAREKGDLRENADYHAARESIALNDARIADLRSKISMAAIVDKSKMCGETVVFGATVKLLNLDDQEEEEYTLVGAGESDPLNNKILTSSPMGQALLTHKVGDEVQVPAPKGTLRFRILVIRF